METIAEQKNEKACYAILALQKKAGNLLPSMAKRQTQMYKPKNAAEKKNHIKIRFEVRQMILKRFKELQDGGSVLSFLDDSQISNLADQAANYVMTCEKINISLKRRFRC
jgi:DNA repair photolyase